MNGFERALPIILRFEGGYANDPADPGGETMMGITKRVWDEWVDAEGVPRKPMNQLTEDDVAPIYQHRYWTAAHCETLPWPFSLIHFDCAVNAGVGPATKQMQRALGVTPDGVFGPRTRLEAESAGPRECYRYLLERVFFYRGLASKTPAMTKFLVGGWLGRVQYLYREVG